MNFIKLIINFIKKDYNKVDKQGALIYFHKIVDSFRLKAIWEKKENKWYLKFKVQ
tara:strand:+ start:444 stop:608 length:165 start_codon:yes stop_codon:yes gene_type:complete